MAFHFFVNETALFAACYYNNFDVARFLINNGADVNKGNKDEFHVLCEKFLL